MTDLDVWGNARDGKTLFYRQINRVGVLEFRGLKVLVSGTEL